MNTNVPTLNLDHFVSGFSDQKNQFVQDLGDAFRYPGFVIIKNPALGEKLIDTFYQESKEFFHTSLEVKSKYEKKGSDGQRGYTSFGKEHAKHSNVGDLKEFFQIGQEDNVVVEEIPRFTQNGVKLYRQFERTGMYLMRAVALYLGLPENYFDKATKEGNSILRSIFYPPITKEPGSAVRSERHEDINLITLLVGASAGGLQLLNKEKEWNDILPKEGEIAVNVGDMLQRWTNNYLQSTTHRVVNPPRERWHEERLSIPFFYHPRSETDLTCLDCCVDIEHPAQYEPITAGEYLGERLREIGLA